MRRNTFPLIGAAAALAALVLPVTTAGAKIIGRDDRTTILPPPFAEAKGAVGMILSSSRSCTAFCVAEDVIATNSHCLFDQAGKWLQRYRHFTYQTRVHGAHVSRVVAGADEHERVLNIVFGGRKLNASPKRLWPHQNDWALLRISRGACPVVLPLKPTANLRRSTRKGQLGLYSVFFRTLKNGNSTGPLRRFSPNCRFVSNIPGMPKAYQREFTRWTRNRKKTLHTCDTEGGQSGSPILYWDGKNALNVVAVNSGHQNYWYRKRGGKRRTAHVNLAAPATAIKPSLDRFTSETVADREGIKRIQRALARRKLYKAKPTGMFDAKTRRAIQRFEKKAGWPRLGLPTTRLLKALNP